jgi:FLVCR family feline leukemia virus subgroup C receptor-related protein
MTSIGMSTLNPIAAELELIYGYSAFAINLGGLAYILMHPLFTFPAAYVIDNKGVRAGIIVGSVLSLIGVCLRLLINQGFWIVILGQVLAGIGRPFILNCQAKISANWFTAGKRVTFSCNVGWYHSAIDTGCQSFANYWDTHSGNPL